MSTVKRITLSIPLDLAEDLDYLHKRVGVSKSAFVSSLLGEVCGDLRDLLESLPDEPSPDDIVRFRGASVELAQNRIARIQQRVGD
tara:strand:+ start:1236 stop:1493 length:258 start_codon:yes stop_codon:yes gene_type:complete